MIPQLWDLIEYAVNDGKPTTIPIIWSHQNAPRVGKPYILIEYTNVDTPNFDIYMPEVDEYGVQTIGSWRNASVNLQFFFGPDSQRMASQTVFALATERVINKAVELDCAVGQRLFYSSVPALINDSQWESRTIYSFEFMWSENYADQVGVIEYVDITGTYIGGLADPDALINQCKHLVSKDDCPTVWDNYTTVWDYHVVEPGLLTRTTAPVPYTAWDIYLYAIWDKNVAKWDGHDERWDERWCHPSVWDKNDTIWDKGNSLWDCDIL